MTPIYRQRKPFLQEWISRRITEIIYDAMLLILKKMVTLTKQGRVTLCLAISKTENWVWCVINCSAIADRRLRTQMSWIGLRTALSRTQSRWNIHRCLKQGHLTKRIQVTRTSLVLWEKRSTMQLTTWMTLRETCTIKLSMRTWQLTIARK